MTVKANKELKALIFDCDGVILESEECHRVAYNAAFAHFDVRPKGGEVAEWSVKFYDALQNKVGGGKPKMRWYFGEFGWPTSSVLPTIPETEDEKTTLVDVLQAWKTTKYQDLIASGEVETRPGILNLFDEARDAGLKVGVCSAATKSSAICVLENLLGAERFRDLDIFMAGDDVPNKKPDPSIYRIAAERLQLDPAECFVIEDSTIGLKAATGAGMRCMITYTSSTEDQDFHGAERVVFTIAEADPPITIKGLQYANAASDDRSAAKK